MLYRESGEFPFDNTREPYEGADIEKADWAKRFFCLYDIKAGNLKCIPLFFQIIVRKRLPHSGKDRVHKFSVVFTSHLLRDEKTAGFQHTPDLRRVEIAMAINYNIKRIVSKGHMRSVCAFSQIYSQRQKLFTAELHVGRIALCRGSILIWMTERQQKFAASCIIIQ